MPLSFISSISRTATPQAKKKPNYDVSLNITISSVNNVTTSIINNYYIITFTSNSTITFNKSYTGNVLIVGGGGSSGQGGGTGLQSGGGGGGGVGTGNLTFSPGTQYSITIGNGGSMYHNGIGLGGQSTTIIGGTINETATGGLSGCASTYGGTYGYGGNSGSGSGVLSYNTTQNGGTQGSTTAGIAGPGGGGASSAGSNILSTATTATAGGNGGTGVLWNINGNYYGGGGGGAGSTPGSIGGTGGSGNGGQGACSVITIGTTAIGCPGVAGTGGGGGGGLTAGAMSYAGEGGSGVVIIAFPLSNIPIITFNNLLTFSPTSITNCILWLDPADSSKLTTVDYNTNTTLGTIPGTFISQWNDKSGSGNNFTQSTYNNQPLKLNTTINGFNTIVSFTYSTSSTYRFFTNSTISLGTSYSIFAICYTCKFGGPLVYGSTVNTAYNLYFGSTTNGGVFTTYVGNGTTAWNDTTNTGIALYGAPPNSKGGVIYLIGATNDGTSTGLIPYYNGTAQTAKNGTTVSFQGMGILGVNNNSFNAINGDIIIYNKVLSQAERQKVEGYLAWKWGVNGNLPVSHPYYSVPPT